MGLMVVVVGWLGVRGVSEVGVLMGLIIEVGWLAVRGLVKLGLMGFNGINSSSRMARC